MSCMPFSSSACSPVPPGNVSTITHFWPADAGTAVNPGGRPKPAAARTTATFRLAQLRPQRQRSGLACVRMDERRGDLGERPPLQVGDPGHQSVRPRGQLQREVSTRAQRSRCRDVAAGELDGKYASAPCPCSRQRRPADGAGIDRRPRSRAPRLPRRPCGTGAATPAGARHRAGHGDPGGSRTKPGGLFVPGGSVMPGGSFPTGTHRSAGTAAAPCAIAPIPTASASARIARAVTA